MKLPRIQITGGSKELPIDKHIPVPIRHGGRSAIYPWDKMNVGDSFFVPGKTYYQVSGSVNYHRIKHPGWKMSGRNLTENGVAGVRFWRIA